MGVEHVLVVDHDPLVRALAGRALHDAGYRCDVARGAAQTAWALTRATYDVVICDARLAGPSGHPLARDISELSQDDPTLILTGTAVEQLPSLALELGADAYIGKPFTVTELLLRVQGTLRRREQQAHASDAFEAASVEMLQRLSSAVEARDPEVASHISDMSMHSYEIARALGLSAKRSDLIRIASALHDVGKIGIPDRVLLKPGPLTADERTEMQRHAEIGYRILAGSKAELVQLSASIAFTHHEKFDRTGYPRGLAGPEIPLEGRIAAVADVFDALTRNRVYRPRLPEEEALGVMREGRGTHFDPDVLDVFLGEVVPAREQSSPGGRAAT